METRPFRPQLSAVLCRVIASAAVVLAISTCQFSYAAGDAPVPLLEKGHPVDWWFVFKFNTASFPACSAGAEQSCPFGGEVQIGKKTGQQFVFASSENHSLKKGSDWLGSEDSLQSAAVPSS